MKIYQSVIVLLCQGEDMLFLHQSRLCSAMNLVSYLAFNYFYCHLILVHLSSQNLDNYSCFNN